LRIAAVGALAVVTGLGVTALSRQAEHARDRWGEGVPVLIATRDLAPGDQLSADATRVVERPEPLVPADALAALDDRVRVAAPIYADEVVVPARLVPGSLSSTAARLRTGTRAVAVPLDPATSPPLQEGDRVDVVVALPEAAAGDGPPGFAIASEVDVVDVDDAAATLAIPRDDVPRVAVALGQGAVTLALVGG
jgi:Flp pilus assembly protein CpaB